MREQNVSSFKEISREAEREEDDALVEDRRWPSTLDEAKMGRRCAQLSQRGNAEASWRSSPQQSAPHHGFMGLVLIHYERPLAIEPA